MTLGIASDEVGKIAGQLRQAEVFQDDSGYEFQLQNDENGYVLLIPLIGDATMTPEAEDFMKQLSNFINRNAGLKKSLSVAPDNRQE